MAKRKVKDVLAEDEEFNPESPTVSVEDLEGTGDEIARVVTQEPITHDDVKKIVPAGEDAHKWLKANGYPNPKSVFRVVPRGTVDDIEALRVREIEANDETEAIRLYCVQSGIDTGKVNRLRFHVSKKV